MSLIIRPATPNDTAAMADLLGQIIAIGGTTAHTSPVDANTIQKWMDHAPSQSAWHVAESPDGAIMGFQFIEPHPDLPADTGDIATFVRVGATGQSIGRQLFVATRQAAVLLGYFALVAVIRADNTSGLAYYSARGFADIDRLENQTLGDGQVVDKIVKRHALIDIRPAVPIDANDMGEMLGLILRAQNSPRPCDPNHILTHYITHPDSLACTVAKQAGRIIGFQSLRFAVPDNAYGVTPGWGIIGSYVHPEFAGQGVGKLMFTATRAAALSAGLPAIDATIGAENSGGQAYYRAMGFQDYRATDTAVCKRYDLPALS